ncbi:hypothetical protein QQP08_025332 [Theobroma cacao]|nr:hypothetical protein QQP08_025332 [Theobroma cacao]
MWVNHFTKLSFLQLIPTPFPALLSELFTSSAVPRFRSIALEFKFMKLGFRGMGDCTLQETCHVVAMGEANFCYWICHLHCNLDDFMICILSLLDKLLTSKIVAEVAIRKSINTNAISVVEKFQKVRLKFPFSILW